MAHPTKPIPTLRPTARDLQLVILLARLRVLRDTDFQAAFFGRDPSTCQRRLTQLYKARWLDRLPRRAVTSQHVYVLSRRSVQANRILKERWGEEAFKAALTPIVNLDHLLGVNAVRVRLMRASRDLGWSLRRWMSSEQLEPYLAPANHLIPDAFFGLQRQVNNETKTSGFCLELQRSLKSNTVLVEKLKKYDALYYTRQYEAIFGLRSLRVLFVYTSEPGASGEDRVLKARQRARSIGNTIARFASLDVLSSHDPVDILTKPLWWRADPDQPVSLYSV